jgi:F-type H+-transporting ATPase subunit a
MFSLTTFGYGFTVTSHIAVTAALAVLVFIVVLAVGFLRHGLHFFSLFWPKGVHPALNIFLLVPIEVISFLARPLTLAIRLFANMTAGHVLLKVFGGFIVSLGLAGGLLTPLAILPFAGNVLLMALELLVAVLQAYVFALLTSIYLNDAVNLH